ncbi:MAG: polysaccharide biosynthesis protein [Bacteroidetes bacterium]|nr:polysaccharide biosynthesis protein [Bacteroidota bacterium]MBU1718104.1 polysaccharide biosynthesis protein [Bacteroidota bacterium]
MSDEKHLYEKLHAGDVIERIINIPRWVILLIDVAISFVSVALAYMLRFNFQVANMPETDYKNIWNVVGIILCIRFISFLAARLHLGYFRYIGVRDAVRIFFTVLSGSVAFSIINLYTHYHDGYYLIPYGIVVGDFIISIFLMTGLRVTGKIFFMEVRNPRSERKNVIVFGAGELGQTAKKVLERDFLAKARVAAFIDDDARKSGKSLEGIRIYPISEFEKVMSETRAERLILAVKDLSVSRKAEITEMALHAGLRVQIIPPASRWINGELSFNQLKDVKIEDLLNRDPIVLNESEIRKELFDKIVLVTGAAGSIGSGLAHQIIGFRPKMLYLLDQAESPLFDLDLELGEQHRYSNFETVIADVRNEERMRNVFNTFRPEVVFHAAAYKHVPVMENNPSEAILTNVLGSKITADLSAEFGVKKFVMISTDKAVNPTNVMGASKRIAEMYVQALGNTTTTRFVTTRFGNVLGSNGSVVPRFRKQIEQGGPITVTHPEITRYFMTIPEACQLVLEAGAMGNGGEIFLFDMGKPVRIIDLARKMVQLASLSIGKDIQIIFTGLRPGEKLYEELMATSENSIPTHHPKIMKAMLVECDYLFVSGQVDNLVSLFFKQDNNTLVQKMKDIVPEYRSMNSIFEALDKKDPSN